MRKTRPDAYPHMRRAILGALDKMDVSVFRLAEMAGLNRTTIDNFLKEKSTNFTLTTAESISKEIGLPLGVFLGIQKNNKKYTINTDGKAEEIEELLKHVEDIIIKNKLKITPAVKIKVLSKYIKETLNTHTDTLPEESNVIDLLEYTDKLMAQSHG